MTLLSSSLKNVDESKSKNYRYMTPTHTLGITDALILFKNPIPDARITLIKPPIIFSKNSYSTPIAMPLGLAYIAAVLEKAGYPVQLIDCPGRNINNIKESLDGRFHVVGMDADASIAIIDPRTDIIGITIMFSQEWPYLKNYIQKVRKAFPLATIVVGGEHVTAMPEYSLDECLAIDYLVTGEGEMAFLELAYKLRKRQSIEEVRGIAYRKGKTIVRSGVLPRLADIKKMPWPAWHLVDLEPYFQPNYTMGISHGRNIAMLATRGCPYQCTFCSNPQMWTTRYTMRDVSDVVDEMENYIKKYAITSVDFYDLTAIVKKSWIMDFINELKMRKLKIVWQLPSGTRSESLDEEVLTGLKETGCQFVVYAPESGSQRTLDRIKKRVNLKKLEESIVTALKKELIVKVNFIIGFPFENRIDIYKTLFFSWKLACMKTQDCNVSPFSPYPGSELFQELEKEGRFGVLNDNYFLGLITQFDFTVPQSFCRRVSGVELMFYRTIGMAIFYLLSYVRCPSRILRCIKLIFKNSSFKANSLFEQRIFDLKVRLQSNKN